MISPIGQQGKPLRIGLHPRAEHKFTRVTRLSAPSFAVSSDRGRERSRPCRARPAGLVRSALHLAAPEVKPLLAESLRLEGFRTLACQSALDWGSDSLLMQFEGCLAL
jgi:hypothetical protein